PGYHPLDDLKARLDESQQHLDHEILGIARGVDAEYRAATRAEAGAQSEIETVKAQAAFMNQSSLRDAILARDVVNNRDLYRSALQRMNELGMTTSVFDAAVAVMDPARPPEFAASPEMTKSLGIALALGLFGGVGGAFLLESFDDGIKSRSDAEALLDLPVLGTVPDFGKIGYDGRITPDNASPWIPIP